MVEEVVAQAEAGEEAASSERLRALSQLLYEVPAGAVVDDGVLSRVRNRCNGLRDDLSVAIGAVALLLAWHVKEPCHQRRVATAEWLGQAVGLAESADPRQHPLEVHDLALTGQAVTHLLGTVDSNPSALIRLLTRGAQAALHAEQFVPAGRLLLDAITLADVTSSDDSEPRAHLDETRKGLLRILTQASRPLLPLDSDWSQTPVRLTEVARLHLRVHELCQAPDTAWFVRLDLASGLLAEGLVPPEDLIDAIASGPHPPDIDPNLDAAILRARVSLVLGNLSEATRLAKQLVDHHPQGRDVDIRLLAAAVAAGCADWAAARRHGDVVVDAAIATSPVHDAPRDGVVSLITQAAFWAYRCGDQPRVSALRDALAAPGREASSSLALPLVDAWSRLQHNDIDAAVAEYEVALARTRAGIRDVQSVATGSDRVHLAPYLAEVTKICGKIADLHLLEGRAAEAFTAIELERGEFLRALHDPYFLDQTPVPPGSFAGRAAFLDEASRQLPSPTTSRERALHRLAQQPIRRLRSDSVLPLLYAPVAPSRDLGEDLDCVLAAAGPRACVVTLQLGDEAVGVIATADGRQFVSARTAHTHAALENLLLSTFTRARGSGPDPGDPDWVARSEGCLLTLSDLVAAPILAMVRRLGRSEVVLSVTGPLSCVPFMAIPCVSAEGKETTLGDELAGLSIVVGIGTAGRALQQEHSDPSAEEKTIMDRYNGTVLVTAVADDSIPFAQMEARIIAGVWQDNGNDVDLIVPLDQGALVTRAPRARILHIAAHARWDQTMLTDSGIGGFGSWVDAGELYRALDLSKAELVILSACDTADTVLAPGNEPVNLAQLVAAAGARQVIASLWKVDDLATLLMMSEFHHRIALGAPPHQALAQAQRTLRNHTVATVLDTMARWPPSTIVSDAATALRARHPAGNDRPFASSNHWAAFHCYGPPIDSGRSLPVPSPGF